MLGIIDDALQELLSRQHTPPNASERVQIFKTIAGKDFFTRKDYLQHFKAISVATASRDLAKATEEGILQKEGDKRLAKYRFG